MRVLENSQVTSKNACPYDRNIPRPGKILYLEYENSNLFRHVGAYPPVYMVSEHGSPQIQQIIIILHMSQLVTLYHGIVLRSVAYISVLAPEKRRRN
jgi:hypothetical protein